MNALSPQQRKQRQVIMLKRARNDQNAGSQFSESKRDFNSYSINQDFVSGSDTMNNFNQSVKQSSEIKDYLTVYNL